MRNYTISGGFGLTCRAITTTNLAVVNFRRVRGGRDSGEGPVGSEHEQSRFLRAIFFPRRFRHLFHIGVGCVYTYPRPFPYRLPYPRFFYDRFARFLCFFSRFLVVGFFSYIVKTTRFRFAYTFSANRFLYFYVRIRPFYHRTNARAHNTNTS